MLKTKITEMLGIDHPIVGGTMMWLSDAKFTAAISNAGALGILASASYDTKDKFRDEVKKLKDLTDKPFAVNLNLFPALRPIPLENYLEVVVEEDIKIIETSGHKAPEEFIAQLKQAGVTCIHKCVGVRYARKAESLGVDIVTVVGWENGGATGVLDTATLVLVPRVVESINLPVIGGGGVGDGRGVLALLSLGAEGVIVGTRLLLAEECPIHPNLKNALLEATELDTRLVLRSLGNTHRIWNNDVAKKVAELEEKKAEFHELIPYITGEQAKKMYDGGDINVGMIAAGQALGLSKEIKPVKDIIEEMTEQAEQARTRLAAM